MKVIFEDYKEVEGIFKQSEILLHSGVKEFKKFGKDEKDFITSLFYVCKKSVLSEMEVV